MQSDQAIPAAVAAPTAAVRGLPRRAFARWRQAMHAVGVVQTRLLMLLVYVCVALPTGLLARMVRDPLHLQPPAGGNWSPVEEDEASVDKARLQF